MSSNITATPVPTGAQSRALTVSVINQFLSARCEAECPICYGA